jgi:hypothetical protein
MKVFDFLFDENISKNIGEQNEFLPFVHTTKSFDSAMKILQKKKLERKLDDVFKGERLLYFYYARPARRFKMNSNKSKLYIPVVFIIKPIIDNIKRIYPFDTGAYNKYIENGRLNSTTEISDYELSNNLFSIKQYINTIFGDNNNYFYGKCKADSELLDNIVRCRKANPDLDNLLNLIAERKDDGIDDRRKTIEIQIANDYHFSGRLEAVFVPYIFQNDKKIVKIMKAINAELWGYEYYDISNISNDEQIHSIYNSVRKYYTSKGYITSRGNYED